MSNIIKSNYIYVATDDKKVLSYENINFGSQNNIPGMSTEGTDGFKNIDYSDEAYKIDTILRQEAEREEALIESARKDIIEDANSFAEQIVAQAKEKARLIIEEAENEAAERRKAEFEEAKNEGYAQGYDLAQRDVEELRQALAIQLQANNEDYENKMCQLEYDMVDVMVGLIEKITGIEIEDKSVILHILDRTFSGIENSTIYQIRVSDEDYPIVNDYAQELYQFVREGSSIEVYSDSSLQKNQCQIETDGNVIDCSLDEQLKNICRELKLLSLN